MLFPPVGGKPSFFYTPRTIRVLLPCRGFAFLYPPDKGGVGGVGFPIGGLSPLAGGLVFSRAAPCRNPPTPLVRGAFFFSCPLARVLLFFTPLTRGGRGGWFFPGSPLAGTPQPLTLSSRREGGVSKGEGSRTPRAGREQTLIHQSHLSFDTALARLLRMRRCGFVRHSGQSLPPRSALTTAVIPALSRNPF